jgi:hypothetical protein
VCPSPQAEPGGAEPASAAEVPGEPGPTLGPPKPKRKGHGRNPASCYRGAEQVKVAHPGFSSGDPCPNCPKGKVYPMAKPAVLVRVVGMSPLSAWTLPRNASPLLARIDPPRSCSPDVTHPSSARQN